MLEFYSSWCGHCQRFAPTLTELANDMRMWSSVVRIGVVECTLSENRDTCTKTFGVRGFPTVMFFNPRERKPLSSASSVVGARNKAEVERMILNHIEAARIRPDYWPSFQPLVNARLLELPASAWKPAIFVFESENTPILGKQLILDFSSVKTLLVLRVERGNVEFIKHYSVLEFPSVAIEIYKNDHHIISGALFVDPRTELRKAITAHISTKLSGGVALTTEGEGLGLSPEHVRALDQRSKPPITHRASKVSSVDILAAISYAFRMEVPIHNIISGHAFTTLLRFTHLLESAFTLAHPAAASGLRQVRIKLEVKQPSGFILNRDWKRIVDAKLDPTLFPVNVTWHNCQGSQPHLRGYPCGLWMLMHAVTVLTLPVRPRFAILPNQRIDSKEALTVLANFVETFFSCDDCRQHFTEMAQGLSEGGLRYHGDAVLWLWEAHNTVNQRLSSADPLHSKLLFPQRNVCPYCYNLKFATSLEPSWNNTRLKESMIAAPDDWQTSDYVWNRTAVFLYLCNFYQSNVTSSVSELLEAAWPQRGRTADLYPRPELGFSGVDTGLCLTSYLLCVLLLATLTYMVFRRKFRRVLHSKS